MKTPRVRQENKISARDFGQEHLETVGARLQAKEMAECIAVEINPQHLIQPVSKRFPALEEQEIILTLLDPAARQVNLAGNFNGWRPETTPMKNTGAGKWVVRLMLRSGQYEYRFVVDGRWIEDPGASQRVASPYGGFNSILKLPLEVRTSIL
ncbi:MAG: isoamylase early set domain-containing protein [Terracidiphilus sp.]|jgi:1,4-alpha-glucan branching enzyme